MIFELPPTPIIFSEITVLAVYTDSCEFNTLAVNMIHGPFENQKNILKCLFKKKINLTLHFHPYSYCYVALIGMR